MYMYTVRDWTIDWLSIQLILITVVKHWFVLFVVCNCRTKNNCIRKEWKSGVHVRYLCPILWVMFKHTCNISLACRILVHSTCIRQLYYCGIVCKPTFREIKQKVKDVRQMAIAQGHCFHVLFVVVFLCSDLSLWC